MILSLMLTKAACFDQTYSKNSNAVKFYYNLKLAVFLCEYHLKCKLFLC